MSKIVQSIDVVNTDGTTITGIVDPTVVLAAQTYVDSLNPPSPSPVITTGPTPTKVLPQTLSADYALAPGSYAVDPKAIVKGNASIYSIDPKNPATLLLPACWPATTPKSPDVGTPLREGTIQVAGSLTLKDLQTRGAANVDPQDIIFLGSQTGAKITATNILMDGGGFYRGGGASSIVLTRINSTGKPRAYFFALFDSQLNTLTWDNTGCQPIQQGGRIVGGSPQGEAAIRLMWGQNVSITGLHVIGWKYDGTHYWKQVVQDRAGGDVGDYATIHTWTNCTIDGPAEIGWMGGKRDPSEVQRPLGTSKWVNSTLQSQPVDHYGHTTQIYQSCTIGGKAATKNITGKK